MPDEPVTTAEVWRRMDDMRDEMRRGFAAVNTRLDKIPPAELVDHRLNDLRGDVTALETARANSARDSRDAKRWAIAAVAIPMLTILATLILSLRTVA